MGTKVVVLFHTRSETAYLDCEPLSFYCDYTSLVNQGWLAKEAWDEMQLRCLHATKTDSLLIICGCRAGNLPFLDGCFGKYNKDRQLTKVNLVSLKNGAVQVEFGALSCQPVK